MKFGRNLRHLLLAILVISSLAALVIPVQASGGPILATTEIYTRQDEDFTTKLYITEGANICDFQISLSYDTELLELVSAKSLVGSSATINTGKAGLIQIAYSAADNIAVQTEVVELVFHVDSNAGIGAYDCLTVNTAYKAEASRLDDATGAFEDVEVTTAFSALVLYEVGDVNLDQRVSVRDVSLLKRHLSYMPTTPTLTEFHLRIADAERDDRVNMRDVARIMRRCAYYMDDIYGDRINIYFYDVDGNQYAVRSVLYGGDLNKLPAVPLREHYEGGQWSASPDSYVAPDLTGIEKELKLYAVYGEYQSEAIAYYKQVLTAKYYGGDLPTGLTGTMSLVSELVYQNGFSASVIWQSDNNYILNGTTGFFNKPTYASPLTLTALITSYDANGSIEARDSIDFVYQVPGIYATPTKEEIALWIYRFFDDPHVEKATDYDPADPDSYSFLINYDLDLPRRISDENFSSANTGNFEVRLSWTYLDEKGNELPITTVSRTTSPQVMDLIATVTFNGKPLEDDGRIYVDDVQVTAIQKNEIKHHIIGQIADNVQTKLSDGVELWHNDTVYGTTIVWETGNVDVATIADNVVNINQSVVTGTLLPLNVTVSYGTVDEEGQQIQDTFTLSYTASVITNSDVLSRSDVDPGLYDAILYSLKELNEYSGDTLTTAALRAQEFVSLDLSAYNQYVDEYNAKLTDPDATRLIKVTSLKGLSYCTNLHALDISGVKVTDGSMNQIATLSKLEILIARDCDLESMSVGATAVLDNALNLKVLDLSNNRFTRLDSVLSADVTYGQLREVYLSNNQLYDISALSSAPALSMLSLSGNGLKTEDLSQLANFPYLNYLSLAHNEIDSVEPLSMLVNLTDLRLQHNQITDVTALRSMEHMRALYLGHNHITSGVEYLSTMRKLEVLYLNDNDIASISALSSLTRLKAVNLTNNPRLQDLSPLSGSKETMNELYAENNSITTFNFIEGMSNLRILMLSGNAPDKAVASERLTGQLSALVKLQVLTLNDKPLLDLDFLANMPLLVRLDVANCGLTATKDIASISALYGTLKILNISNNPFTDGANELLKLKDLDKMLILYADNTCSGLNFASLANTMTQLQYLSLENCGVTSLDWMKDEYNLVFVDLAGNQITDVDLAKQISLNCRKTLKYLYLDTDGTASFADAYSLGLDADSLSIEHLSLENVSVPSVAYLPLMESLTYLNLENSGLTDLSGGNDLGVEYPITRFKALQTLDLSGLELDLAPVLQLQNLKTLYAVHVPASQMFYKSNLHLLQQLYNNGITCHLYDNETKYVPTAQKEGTAILNLLKDFSCEITVAADGMISDNNPVLPTKINDYEITWTVSNTTNYQIVNNKLAVKSYANIDDEKLTLTAAIRPYDDQQVVTRKFYIDTKILRLSSGNRAKYCSIDSTGLESEFQRGDTFTYHVTLKAAQTAGFTKNVKPVVDEIAYTYSTVLASGGTSPYVNTLSDQGSHRYAILSSAPLNASTTITVKLGHKINGTLVVDDTMSVKFTVRARTYTLTYAVNGGTVKDSNGQTVTSQKKSEEAVLFQDITVTRTGYLFGGWYSDAALTNLYWKEGSDAVKMPAKDMTVYAKWTAHSFTLYFDANGGSVSEASRTILCDQPFGTLPTPTRTGYDFNGWFTKDGKQITATTTMSTAEDVTVYAKWTVKSYSATWSGGTGYSITVKRTSSPNQGAAAETLKSGAKVYYGDVLSVTYTAAAGYQIDSSGSTKITVSGNVTASQIYAKASLRMYKVSWNTGTGYTIAVSRTKSPLGGAATGSLSSGSIVYYGDVLAVTYKAATGYTLGDTGDTSITVDGNITSSRIFAKASANSYTYQILYRSTNGTDLGSAAATYKYGTTNTITPPAISGYDTPGAQSVAWDSVNAKTITFTYAPSYVSSYQYISSGTWWTKDGAPRLTYDNAIEFQNRTATSIEVRVVWANYLASNYYYGFKQCFNASINGVGTGDILIASASHWSSNANYAREVWVSSGWVTLPLNTTGQITLPVSGSWWDNAGRSGSCSGSFVIPAF